MFYVHLKVHYQKILFISFPSIFNKMQQLVKV